MATANVTGLGYLGTQITFLDLDFYECLSIRRKTSSFRSRM